MMFKILVIQATNNLSDERAEFLINDGLSFMRFLGLNLVDRVPDARTIWLFREKLTKADTIRDTVRALRRSIAPGRLYRHGRPDRRRHTHHCARAAQHQDEKAALKQGRIPEEWKASRPSCARRIAMRAGR